MLFDVLSEGFLIVILGKDVVAHGTLLTVMAVDVFRHLILSQISHDAVTHGARLLRGVGDGAGVLTGTTQQTCIDFIHTSISIYGTMTLSNLTIRQRHNYNYYTM